MTVLPQLEQDLFEAANRRHLICAEGAIPESGARISGISDALTGARATHAGLRARLRRLRVTLIVFVCLLASTTIALAASGVILTGAPVRPEGQLSPNVGEGVPTPGASRLLPLRVPDPEGGLPWGMRIVRTTRGEVCVQIGRVEHGQLGELGIDGVFHDDGRFHPLPADVLPETSRVGVRIGNDDATETVSCQLVGQVTVGVHRGVDRSAGGANGGEGARPLGDLRDIYYGILGKPAVSVSYRAGATVLNVAVLRPLGAYLIVRRATPGEQAGTGGGSLGSEGDLPPSPPLTTITYRLDGKLCERGPVQPPGVTGHLADPCPSPHWPVGHYVRPHDLHQPIDVRLQVKNRAVVGARLSFTAPFAVRSAREDYEIRIPGIPCTQVTAEEHGLGEWPGSGVSLGRDIARGSTVAHWLSATALFDGVCGLHRRFEHVSRSSATVGVLYRRYEGAAPVLVGTATIKELPQPSGG